jgi:protein O-GlcNAc transferase
MAVSQPSKKKKTNVGGRKPVQLNYSKPTISTAAKPAILAATYYQHAVQAYQTQRWSEVCQLTHSCIDAAPNDITQSFQAKNLFAAALTNLQQPEQALIVWQKMLQDHIDHADTLANIGITLIKLTRYNEAVVYLQRLIELTPHHAERQLHLGFALHKCDEITKAKVHYLQALKLNPRLVDAQFNLARVYQDEGNFAEACATYAQVLKLDPRHRSCSSIICMQHYRYPIDMLEQMELLHLYGQHVSNEIPSNQIKVIQETHKQLKTALRVGFVSGDLHQCPVGFFLESTIEQIHLNASLNDQVTLLAYSNDAQYDVQSARLQTHFAAWHQVETWDDMRLLQQISADHIDILIDLSGHNPENRLAVFAQHAAPLQLSWLGYYASTGIAAIDYVLADPICVQPDEEQWFCEKIWRLPHLRYCFTIPVDAPAVSPTPCLVQPHIVFGCFQSLLKINEGVLRCWQQILVACPHARLRIQAKELDTPLVKKQFVQQLKNAGIMLEQIDLADHMTRQSYLSSYGSVDILLDTFPFTGGTTTAEALWMGVPTISLATPNMIGRQGEALLVNAGLADWVVHSEDDYIKKAMTWASADIEKKQVLSNLRSGMREQVKKSPVFNAAQFAQDFVHALNEIWNEKYSVEDLS